MKIKFSKKGYGKFKIVTEMAGHPILIDNFANECMFDTLSEGKPCFIARFGSVEIETVDYYLQYKNNDGQCVFPDYMKDSMRNQTGFFTPTNELLSKYCKETVNMIKNIDILGVWNYCNKSATGAWINAQGFKNYLINSGRGSYIAKGYYCDTYKAAFNLRPGDIVAYEKKGRITHVSTVTGLDSKGYPLVTCHNTDRMLVPYDLGWSNSNIKFHFIDVHY